MTRGSGKVLSTTQSQRVTLPEHHSKPSTQSTLGTKGPPVPRVYVTEVSGGVLEKEVRTPPVCPVEGFEKVEVMGVSPTGFRVTRKETKRLMSKGLSVRSLDGCGAHLGIKGLSHYTDKELGSVPAPSSSRPSSL